MTPRLWVPAPNAVARAHEGARHWAATPTAERRRMLNRVAEVMAAARGRTIAVMAHETAKTVRWLTAKGFDPGTLEDLGGFADEA